MYVVITHHYVQKQDVKDWRDFSLGPRVIISFLIHNWNSLKNIKCKQVAHINSDGSRPRLEPFHEWRASGLEDPFEFKYVQQSKSSNFPALLQVRLRASQKNTGPITTYQYQNVLKCEPIADITKTFWNVNKQLKLYQNVFGIISAVCLHFKTFWYWWAVCLHFKTFWY